MHLQHSFSFSYRWSYDVFLSFRGTDTRHGFAGNLFSALRDKGIHAFFDDEELRRGDEIKASLVKAIQESRVAIPIFSPNYAASSFCLDELATIMDCVKGKGRLVLPVFYGVDPSHVRHQTETYAEAFAKHEERFKDDGKERVHKWREALHQAANLSGDHFKPGDQYEYVFVEKTVKRVSDIVCVLPLHVANHPVGLESRVLQVKRLLNDRSDGRVHMVGIYGIGGIGKSTLARAVYSSIAGQFDLVCFLENVRENSMKHGLPHLQEILLSKIVGLNIKLGSVNEGIPLIKHRLHGKKILLVLDDVDKLEQLQAIVGGNDWFGFGSSVIITTRDSHLLVSHGIQRKYDVEGLNEKEALQLLTWNAFKEGKVDPSYTHVINLAVTYACGLPLALEVIGSNLVGKSVEEWRSTVGQYERIPNKECQQKISLDSACHFNGCSLERVEDTLCVRHDVLKIKERVANKYLLPKALEVPIMDATEAMKVPVGILHVKVLRATKLRKKTLMGVYPYVKLTLSDDKPPSKKTTVKYKNLNPEWNEEFNMVVKDPKSQVLDLSVYDWEEIGKHDKMGMNAIPLKDLTLDEPKELILDLLKTMVPNDPENEKLRGQLTVEVLYTTFKDDELTQSAEDSNEIEKAPEGTPASGGLLVIIIHEAEDVEGKHHTNPYARLIFKGEERKTKHVKKNRDPRWGETFQFILEEPPTNERLYVEVLSSSSKLGLLHPKETLGYVDINLYDVVSNKRINEQYHLTDSRNGKIQIELHWITP